MTETAPLATGRFFERATIAIISEAQLVDTQVRLTYVTVEVFVTYVVPDTGTGAPKDVDASAHQQGLSQPRNWDATVVRTHSHRPYCPKIVSRKLVTTYNTRKLTAWDHNKDCANGSLDEPCELEIELPS